MVNWRSMALPLPQPQGGQGGVELCRFEMLGHGVPRGRQRSNREAATAGTARSTAATRRVGASSAPFRK